MAVMAKETWIDHRLDDLNKRVDGGFNETREEFGALRAETSGGFQAVRAELGGQIAALHRMTLQLFAGMILTSVLGFGGMIVALLTQS
ncbi:MAG TPA: hypothetical protein VKB23_11025 [Solirubrobacterales bacterium]|nr:hypothetical protein [Solirubrobacterales bacterium]